MEDDLTPEQEQRREYLVRLLSMSALTLAPVSAVEAFFWGRTPEKMPEDKSIFNIEGEFRVNRQLASLDTRIRPGDTVSTGSDSEAIFVVGADSFILRADSEMTIAGSNFLVDSLRVISGGLLSVFGRRRFNQKLNVGTRTATVGIRGTGIYLEAEPDLTYLCTCYGTVDLASAANPNDRETISATHHDQPKYISDQPVKGSQIRKAPFKNHTDAELKLIEALVGREVPFGLETELYRGPRRDY